MKQATGIIAIVLGVLTLLFAISSGPLGEINLGDETRIIVGPFQLVALSIVTFALAVMHAAHRIADGANGPKGDPGTAGMDTDVGEHASLPTAN